MSGLILVKPFKILSVSIRSPRKWWAYNEGSCSICNLSSYDNLDMTPVSFVVLCCTFSNSSTYVPHQVRWPDWNTVFKVRTNISFIQKRQWLLIYIFESSFNKAQGSHCFRSSLVALQWWAKSVGTPYA